MNTDNNHQEQGQDDTDGSISGSWSLGRLMRKHGHFFVLSVLCCLLLAGGWLWWFPPQSTVYVKVLLDGTVPAAGLHADGRKSADGGQLERGTCFENELEILRTKTLSKKVVRLLRLYTTYHLKTRFCQKEIYRKASPYWVELQEDMVDSLPSDMVVRLRPHGETVELELTVGDSVMNKVATAFPVHVMTPCGSVSVARNPEGDESYQDRELEVVLKPLEAVAKDYAAALSVDAVSPTATVVRLSIHDELPERSCDYLRQLVNVYNEEANVDANIQVTRTQDFIDERLMDLSKDFNATDAELKQYRRTGGMARYTPDASADATQRVLQEQRLLEVSTQIDLINYLIEYCNDKHNEGQIVPSNIGLNNDNINTLIGQYNTAVQERSKQQDAEAADSPALAIAANEVESTFAMLKSSLQVAKNQAVVQRNELLSQQGGSVAGQNVSSRNRAFADIHRLQEVKAGLYLMLLQKREENILRFSVPSEPARLIEEPTMVAPSPLRWVAVLVGAVALGLLFPFLFFLCKKRP